MKHQYCLLDWKRRLAGNYRRWLGNEESKYWNFLPHGGRMLPLNSFYKLL
jgi:hypothetical protein